MRLPALLLVAALAGCRRAEPPPGAGFLRFLPADSEVLLVLGDPLTGGEPLFELLAALAPAGDWPALDPARLQLQLQAVSEHLPVRTALALPPEGQRALAALWECAAAAAACRQAHAGGGDAAPARQALARALSGLAGARATVYVAFRDPRTAEDLFERVLDQRRLWAMNPMIEVHEKLDAIEVVLRPGQWLQGPALAGVLSRLGLADSVDAEGVEALARAARGLSFRLTLELVPGGLVAALGPAGRGDPAPLTGLWTAPPPLLYLQWRTAELRAYLEPARRRIADLLAVDARYGPPSPELAGLLAAAPEALAFPERGAAHLTLDRDEIRIAVECPEGADRVAGWLRTVQDLLRTRLPATRLDSRALAAGQRLELRIPRLR